MTALYLNLVIDRYDGQGNPYVAGGGTLTPSTEMPDPADRMLVGQAPVPFAFHASGLPAPKVVSTDSVGPQPNGWTWNLAYDSKVPGSPAAASYYLPAGPVAFTATNASPCVVTWAPTASLTSLPAGTGVQFASGAPAGLSNGVTYFVLSPSGATVQLAATPGGSPLASTGTGSGTLVVVQYNLSALASTPAAQPGSLTMPQTTGTPTSGQVPQFTGAGFASVPVTLTAASVGAASTGALTAEASRAQAAEAAAGTGAVQWVDAYGGDKTGASDSAAAYNAALAALPADGSGPYGAVAFSAGAYKIQAATSNRGPRVHVLGAGRNATNIFKYGSGDTFRAYNPAYPAGFPSQNLSGGSIKGLTIDGGNASAGAVGLHVGDMNDEQLDVEIRHFNGAGSVGLLLDNTVAWTEKMHARCRLWDNTVNVKMTVSDGASAAGVTVASAAGGTASLTVSSGGFPGFYAGMLAYGSGGLVTPSSGNVSQLEVTAVSGNTLTCAYSGTAPSGTGTLTVCSSSQSFDYGDLEFDIEATTGINSGGTNAGQDGVLLANGANPAGGRLVVRGNFQGSNSVPWGATPPAVIHLDGTMRAMHPTQGASYIYSEKLLWQCEGDPANATYAYVPVLCTNGADSVTAHGIDSCEGLMYFDGLAAPQMGAAPFGFKGIVSECPQLQPADEAVQDMPAAGVLTMPLLSVTSINIAVGSGTLLFTYFTAPRQEAVSKVKFPSGNTGAGAAPALVRWGIYSVDGSGDLTLVASTPSDTTLFASSFTTYTKDLSSPVTLAMGQRYALGLLVVTSHAMPTLVGNWNMPSMAWDGPVRLMSSLAGQSDLPSSVAAGSLAWGSSVPLYAYVSP